jgi:hypothetical protein
MVDNKKRENFNKQKKKRSSCVHSIEKSKQCIIKKLFLVSFRLAVNILKYRSRKRQPDPLHLLFQLWTFLLNILLKQ